MASAADRIHTRVQTAMAADQGILDSFGMSVLSAEAGCCEIVARVPAALVNAGGLAHGALAFALMDTACAYALGSLEVRGVTVNAATTYVKGARVDMQLYARVVVASRSGRLATLRGEVYIDTEGVRELAAHGSFIFQLLKT